MTKTDLAIFSQRKLEIKTIIEKYKTLKINWVSDKEWFEKVHRAQMNLKDIRLDINKIYKLFVSWLTQKKKDAFEFKEDLIWTFVWLEDSLKAQKEEILAEKQKIKEEKIRKANEKLEKRVTELAKYNHVMNHDVLRKLSDTFFANLLKVKKSEFEIAQKEAAEKKIEQDKIDKEQKEKQEKIDQDRKRLDKEKEDFEAKKKKDEEKLIKKPVIHSTANGRKSETKKRLRWNVDQMSSAEKAISNAIVEVEKLWADIELTNAVSKLSEIQDIIYDYLT